jgi:hypothetical protein
VKLGDPCSIWDGEGPPGDPRSWLVGIVSRSRMKHGEKEFQVIWNRFPIDPTWYRESDITIKKAERMW